MRRWFLILLMFVLPMQGAWAAAAPYCAHEGPQQAGAVAAAGGAGHWGHHAHDHSAGQASSATALHADCGVCHLGACHALPMSRWTPPAPSAGQVPAYGPPPPCPSHMPAGPERPDKTASLTTARAAVGVGFGLHTA